MTDIVVTRLGEILAARTRRAEHLKARVRGWEVLRDNLQELSQSLAGLLERSPELAALFASVESGRGIELVARIDREALPRLMRVERRFSRERLNLGVAGSARVGKSTLLQAISGLGDGQIPTGDSLPVTAVRSRIVHSSEQCATITFHSWASFRKNTLQPYFSQLKWGAPPETPEAFRHYKPQALQELDEDIALKSGLFDRAKGMIESFASYAALLTGETRKVSLDDLRQFVAYPSSAEQERGIPARKYLAVKDVVIECPFPGNSVRQLGLIDLPGMGEIVAAGEDSHVADLEDEVDVVLLVTNPTKRAYWGDDSRRSLDLALKARCGAAVQDFALPVVNSGGASDGQIRDLKGDIRSKLEAAYGVGNIQILECNARDGKDVRERLMAPLLNHLAERLPVMDKAAFAYAESGLASVGEDVRSFLGSVARAFESVPAMAGTTSLVRQVAMAKELRRRVAADLSGLMERYLQAARSSGAPDFEDAVDACYQRLRQWLENGVGCGAEEFTRRATEAMLVSRGSGALAEDELNRIRVHLATEFCALDSHLCIQVDALLGDLWPVLARALGRDTAMEARQGLRTLEKDLLEAGCRTLGGALHELLALRLDYRTHFHPRLRRALDVLSPQDVDPETLAVRSRIVVEPSQDGAHEMLRQLCEFGEQAAWGAQKSLLENLALPAQVLHAALEQFEDAVIRAGESENEFLIFAEQRRDEIWPGTFEQLDQANRLIAVCRSQLVQAGAAWEQLAGGRV